MPRGIPEWEPVDLLQYTERRVALNALMASVRGSTVKACRETGIPASIVSGIRTGRTVNDAKLRELEDWAAKAFAHQPAEQTEVPVISL